VFDQLAKQKQTSKLDDALYFGAKARLMLGDIKGASAALEALLDTRERTPIPGRLIPGNLNSSKLDDARMLLGEIMRDRVKDTARARHHFEALVDESPDSRLVDDALLALAKLALADGDRARAASSSDRSSPTSACSRGRRSTRRSTREESRTEARSSSRRARSSTRSISTWSPSTVSRAENVRCA
jgi:outer membrane protein assembly factor BamD (BamD/ComL family)